MSQVRSQSNPSRVKFLLHPSPAGFLEFYVVFFYLRLAGLKPLGVVVLVLVLVLLVVVVVVVGVKSFSRSQKPFVLSKSFIK